MAILTVEQAEIQVANGLAKLYAGLAEVAAKDIPARMIELEKLRKDGVTKLITEAKAQAETVTKERDALSKAFTTTALVNFKPIWNKAMVDALRKIASTDDTVSRFTIYVDVAREKVEGSDDVTIKIAEPMASVASKVLKPKGSGNGTGSGRGNPLSVTTPSGDVEYPSARAAQLEILGSDSQMNRGAIVTAINGMDGYTVKA